MIVLRFVSSQVTPIINHMQGGVFSLPCKDFNCEIEFSTMASPYKFFCINYLSRLDKEVV